MPKGLVHLVATFQVKESKLVSVAHAKIPNKTLRDFKDKQTKFKETKLNQNRSMMMTKLKQDKQEKHL